MSINLQSGGSGEAIFLGSVQRNIESDFIQSMVANPDARVVLCITNGSQADTECKLTEFGFKAISTEEKNQHPFQREISGGELTLWAYDLQKEREKALKKVTSSLDRFKEKPGYEFLKWSLEECKKLNKVSLLKLDETFRDDLIYSITVYPFFHLRSKDLTQSNIDRAFEKVKKVVGMYPPAYDPFSGNKIETIDQLNRLTVKLKRGDHLNAN